MSSEFYTTRNMFREYTGYTHPLSYSEWLAAADDCKAALLYCQFFDQITLAWDKSKSYYASEQEAVETVLQYLLKNVPIIIADKSRFKDRYIYQVAYNCFYCISHDRLSDNMKWKLEISNIVTCEAADGIEVNLFDAIQDPQTAIDVDVESRLNSSQFWAMIENLDADTQAVVYWLLGESTLPRCLRGKKRKQITEELKSKLSNTIFVDLYYND